MSIRALPRTSFEPWWMPQPWLFRLQWRHARDEIETLWHRFNDFENRPNPSHLVTPWWHKTWYFFTNKKYFCAARTCFQQRFVSFGGRCDRCGGCTRFLSLVLKKFVSSSFWQLFVLYHVSLCVLNVQEHRHLKVYGQRLRKMQKNAFFCSSNWDVSCRPCFAAWKISQQFVPVLVLARF